MSPDKPFIAMERLPDGSRIQAEWSESEQKFINEAFVHGPHYGDELRRLGITTPHVRVRQEPSFKPEWTDAMHPPEHERFWGKPIPENLRGRTGTFVVDPFDRTVLGLAWGYKYAATAKVRLEEPLDGEHELDVPLVWLETAPRP